MNALLLQSSVVEGTMASRLVFAKGGRRKAVFGCVCQKPLFEATLLLPQCPQANSSLSLSLSLSLGTTLLSLLSSLAKFWGESVSLLSLLEDCFMNYQPRVCSSSLSPSVFFCEPEYFHFSVVLHLLFTTGPFWEVGVTSVRESRVFAATILNRSTDCICFAHHCWIVETCCCLGCLSYSTFGLDLSEQLMSSAICHTPLLLVPVHNNFLVRLDPPTIRSNMDQPDHGRDPWYGWPNLLL